MLQFGLLHLVETMVETIEKWRKSYRYNYYGCTVLPVPAIQLSDGIFDGAEYRISGYFFN